uniref:Uncharacterized protein n=1 Tax=Cacopsylla melanoneura TaxID=428564 RepID=A0A8D9E651_9HEMI
MFHFLLHFLLTGQLCIHCQNFQSPNINDIVDHCRTCTFMPRPHAFKCKFVCHACTSFHTYNITALKNHARVHLEEKPFGCTMCDYRCVQKVQLKLHMNRCPASLN